VCHIPIAAGIRISVACVSSLDLFELVVFLRC